MSFARGVVQVMSQLQDERDAIARQRDLAEETLTRVETERIAALKERDEARRELAACTQACQRLNAQVEPLIEARDEAREAAEIYHEAWQDAAVYWKEKVAALEAERFRDG